MPLNVFKPYTCCTTLLNQKFHRFFLSLSLCLKIVYFFFGVDCVLNNLTCAIYPKKIGKAWAVSHSQPKDGVFYYLICKFNRKHNQKKNASKNLRWYHFNVWKQFFVENFNWRQIYRASYYVKRSIYPYPKLKIENIFETKQMIRSKSLMIQIAGCTWNFSLCAHAHINCNLIHDLMKINCSYVIKITFKMVYCVSLYVVWMSMINNQSLGWKSFLVVAMQQDLRF